MRTEALHEHGRELDTLSGVELAALMARANVEAARAVADASPRIGALIDEVAAAIRDGGRIILIGAGTSGRLAAAEAAECPPTFDTPPELFEARIAGGLSALTRASEGAEDDGAAGAAEVADLRPPDLVIGISASGSAAYVRSALEAARAQGLVTALVTSNPQLPPLAAHMVVLDTGPEVLAGSTRLKAGSAAKAALNAVTTGAMARLGRIYGARMVEVRPTNAKLRRRAIGLVAELGAVDAAAAEALLDESEGDVKRAIVRARRGCDDAEARRLLEDHGRRLREVIG